MSLFSKIKNFGNCAHRRVRCVHGEEVLATLDWMGHVKRVACLDCDRYLNWGLPKICTTTGKEH